MIQFFDMPKQRRIRLTPSSLSRITTRSSSRAPMPVRFGCSPSISSRRGGSGWRTSRTRWCSSDRRACTAARRPSRRCSCCRRSADAAPPTTRCCSSAAARRSSGRATTRRRASSPAGSPNGACRSRIRTAGSWSPPAAGPASWRRPTAARSKPAARRSASTSGCRSSRVPIATSPRGCTSSSITSSCGSSGSRIWPRRW